MKNILLAILLMLNIGLFASENKTKLVIGITFNNFYPEWLIIYQNDLSEGGLKRILSQGKKVMADYNYLYSQTGVDQATIYSGLLPSEHGIVAHDWYERLKKQRQNSVINREVKLLGEEGDGLSPACLQAITLGCAMKMNNAFSKVYSVGVNGEEAVLSGGSCANMAFWLSEKTGKWISSDYYSEMLPEWLMAHNDTMYVDFLIKRGWMPLSEEAENSTITKIKSKIGLSNSFYYDLAQAKRRYETYRILKATPYVNTMVVDLAEELLKSENLGVDNDVDLLALNFSSLDYMNRDFGVYSKEFQDMLMRLDNDIERLFVKLDSRVGKDNYTVFLTFSEARELQPEELKEMRLSADYFSIFKAVALLKSYLSLLYGEGEWVLDYDATQIYLNRTLIQDKKLSLQEIQNKVADFLIEFEGVARVLTGHTLTHNTASSGIEMLFQNTFSQKRSGDVLYSLQSTWLPTLKDKEDYYARYSKRNKIPLYFYGVGTTMEFPETCEMTSLLPMLCEILEIPAPYSAIK